MNKKMSLFFRKYLPGLVLLIGVIIVTSLVVNHFRLPGQSNMIESLAMDMNSMKPNPGSVPVGISQVIMRRGQAKLNYSGTIRGLNEINIASRINGVLSSVRVYTGSQVTKGQLLAQINAPELAAQTSISQAELAEAQAQLFAVSQEAVRLKVEADTAVAGIGEAQSNLNSAIANLTYWQQRLPREQALYEAGGISLEEYQRYQADYKIAESTVTAAQQRLMAASNEHRARTARLGENSTQQHTQQTSISRAGASVTERQIQQGFTKITAPVSGIVTERLQAPGSVVAVGTPILILADISAIRVQIRIPEADLQGLKVGSLLTFSTAARPNEEIETSITSISPTSSAGTRTHIVEAIVDNTEGLLLPGQYIKASLDTGEDKPPQPSIPERALLQIQGQDSVWIIQNGRAHLIPVSVESSGGDWIVVPALKKGTEVITDGYQSLTEGMTVTPVKWTENGPERLPDAGGSERLNDKNGWSLETKVSQELSLKIDLSPKPPLAGTNTINFELLKGSEPESNAKIRLETSMPSMNMPGPTLIANHKDKGLYTTSFSGMSGLWQIMVIIESNGSRLKPFIFEFNIP